MEIELDIPAPGQFHVGHAGMLAPTPPEEAYLSGVSHASKRRFFELPGSPFRLHGLELLGKAGSPMDEPSVSILERGSTLVIEVTAPNVAQECLLVPGWIECTGQDVRSESCSGMRESYFWSALDVSGDRWFCALTLDELATTARHDTKVQNSTVPGTIDTPRGVVFAPNLDGAMPLPVRARWFLTISKAREECELRSFSEVHEPTQRELERGTYILTSGLETVRKDVGPFLSHLLSIGVGGSDEAPISVFEQVTVDEYAQEIGYDKGRNWWIPSDPGEIGGATLDEACASASAKDARYGIYTFPGNIPPYTPEQLALGPDGTVRRSHIFNYELAEVEFECRQWVALIDDLAAHGARLAYADVHLCAPLARKGSGVGLVTSYRPGNQSATMAQVGAWRRWAIRQAGELVQGPVFSEGDWGRPEGSVWYRVGRFVSNSWATTTDGGAGQVSGQAGSAQGTVSEVPVTGAEWRDLSRLTVAPTFSRYFSAKDQADLFPDGGGSIKPMPDVAWRRLVNEHLRRRTCASLFSASPEWNHYMTPRQMVLAHWLVRPMIAVMSQQVRRLIAQGHTVAPVVCTDLGENAYALHDALGDLRWTTHRKNGWPPMSFENSNTSVQPDADGWIWEFQTIHGFGFSGEFPTFGFPAGPCDLLVIPNVVRLFDGRGKTPAGHFVSSMLGVAPDFSGLCVVAGTKRILEISPNEFQVIES